MTMQKKIPVPSDLRLVYRHVRRLFEKHDLDPDNLRDWYTLLHILAPHSGPPAKWFSVTLCMLRQHVEALRELTPGQTDLWYCQQISENKGKYALSEPHFKGINPKTLRRKLAEARKPELQATYDAWCEGGRHHAEEV
jgi:hypothetical protein